MNMHTHTITHTQPEFPTWRSFIVRMLAAESHSVLSFRHFVFYICKTFWNQPGQNAHGFRSNLIWFRFISHAVYRVAQSSAKNVSLPGRADPWWRGHTPGRCCAHPPRPACHGYSWGQGSALRCSASAAGLGTGCLRRFSWSVKENNALGYCSFWFWCQNSDTINPSLSGTGLLMWSWWNRSMALKRVPRRN